MTVALYTSDPKFAPRWVDVPAPSRSLLIERPRYGGWSASDRPITPVEVAYALVDEDWKVSPVSPAVTLMPTTTGWDAIGTTPNVPLWTRATGIMWLWRNVGDTQWKPFACDENRPHAWNSQKPFKPIAGWHHEFAGFRLFPIGATFGTLADCPSSTTLLAAPPAPVVRLLECCNYDYEVAYSWACNERETALSPVLAVPAVAGLPASQNAPFKLLRQMPGSPQQPPQGALGMYVYLRRAGGAWHRQPSPDGLTSYLWNIATTTLTVTQYIESGIAPEAGGGRSYLSSLHLALRDWNRDIIVDSDMTICCPLISEYNGATWAYQPRNHWTAPYSTTTANGTWKLTIDGKSTPAMPRVNNLQGGWAQWQPILDTTFGAGSIKIGDFWPNYAPRIEFAGQYATQDMTGRYTLKVYDVTEAEVDPGIVGGQAGQGWVMSEAQTKFKRKISTSNAGNWKVTDTNVTPDGVTGYPMGWPLWLECSQRTKLQGCDFLLSHSTCGIATCDNSGGGAFHFNVVECTVSTKIGSPSVTYGFLCLDSSGWGWNGHVCSELIMEKVHIQCKFPLVMEGVQAANWQLRDVSCHSDGSFDSAIVTAANGGTLYLGGRFTCDNARTMVASVNCKKITVENLWIDGGMPSLMTCNANSFTTLILNGGKINQWTDWLHAIEAPAGPSDAYQMVLKTDNLDSQTNGPVQAKLCNPKPGQAVYQPRVLAEVPALLQSLLP